MKKIIIFAIALFCVYSTMSAQKKNKEIPTKTKVSETLTESSQIAADGNETKPNNTKGGNIPGPKIKGETRLGADTDLSDIPDWVPSYPGATSLQSTMHSVTSQGIQGFFTCNSPDNVEKTVAFYKKFFNDFNYDISSELFSKTGDGNFGIINGELKNEGRSVNVIAAESKGVVQVTINYNQKKE